MKSFAGIIAFPRAVITSSFPDGSLSIYAVECMKAHFEMIGLKIHFRKILDLYLYLWTIKIQTTLNLSKHL